MNTITLPAPFFFKALAQCETVEPEVIRSSISRTARPSIIRGRITLKAFLTVASRAFRSSAARCMGISRSRMRLC